MTQYVKIVITTQYASLFKCTNEKKNTETWSKIVWHEKKSSQKFSTSAASYIGSN